MPVVDFSRSQGACDVILHAMQAKTDPAAAALIYRVAVTMPLASRSEADQLSDAIPGLGGAWEMAGEDDNWKGTTTVRPGSSVRVSLTAKDAPAGLTQGTVQPGDVVIQGLAELLELKASQSKRARVVQATLVFRGQGPEVAGRLVSNLSRTVALLYESVQAVLQFPERVAPALSPGMIVGVALPGGRQVVGRLAEVDGERIGLMVDGDYVEATGAMVLSSFALAEDPETTAALDLLARRCQETETPVRWYALVETLGAAINHGPVTVSEAQARSALALLGVPEEAPAPAPEPVVVVEPDPSPVEPDEGVVLTLRPIPRRRRAAGLA